jgi:hypothetical protein
MKIHVSTLGLLALLLGSGSAAAQVLCTLEDTEQSCLKKHQADVNQGAEEISGAPAELEETLSKRTTGMAQAVGSDLAASFSDFFSSFKAAADTAPGSDAGGDGAIAFELGHCPGSTSAKAKLQCQARLRLGGATLYEPLKLALPEDTREERTAELEKGLEVGDSITTGVFFNLVGQKFGRVPRFDSEPLFDAANRYASSRPPRDQNALDRAYDRLVSDITGRLDIEFDGETPFTAIANKDPKAGAKLLAAYEEKVIAEFGSMAQMRQRLKEARYFDLVDLVNNQSQLSFGVEYTQRNDLAGPDEWRGKFVWEKGFVNVTSAHDYVYGKGCREAALSQEMRSEARDVGCLQQYLSDPRTQRRLKDGDRLSVSVEYVHRNKYSVGLIADEITLDEKAYNSLIGAASYGYYLDFDDDDEPTSRIDVKASYEDVSGDSSRQDRGVLSATFSQRILGSTILALSLVYGTKPEYRGDVDQEIGAHIGFNYKWAKGGF